MKGLFLIDRNLRLMDHPELHKASKECDQLLFVMIWDDALQGIELNDTMSHNGRMRLMALELFQRDLMVLGHTLHVIRGRYFETVMRLLQIESVDCVYDVLSIEPWYRSVQMMLSEALASKGVAYNTANTTGLFLPNALLKSDGLPYRVFTPYYSKWRQQVDQMKGYVPLDAPKTALIQISRQTEVFQQQIGQLIGDAFDKVNLTEILSQLSSQQHEDKDSDNQILLTESECLLHWSSLTKEWFQAYGQAREYPALEGTSNLSEYINRGTIAIDRMISDLLAEPNGEAFLRQMAWRDFYRQILWHFPYAAKGPFRESYRYLEWSTEMGLFDAWTQGKTGFPIVDAGMRQLVAEGRLHNRLRMVCATFLVKVLGINWQLGEAFFYKHLRDGDVCQNNGGWQWCASTGTDAQPYFRIFNPELQLKKYDAKGIYCKRWLPEEARNVQPIVDYKVSTVLSKQRYQSCKRFMQEANGLD